MCPGTVGKLSSRRFQPPCLYHCTGRPGKLTRIPKDHPTEHLFHIFGACRRRTPRGPAPGSEGAETRGSDGRPSGIRPWPVGVFRRSAWLRKSASAARAVGGTPWAGGTQLAATSAFPFNIIFGACRRRPPRGKIESEGSIGKV